MYCQPGTRFLVSLLIDYSDSSCGDLAVPLKAIRERAQVCKNTRPLGGFAAFLEEELSSLTGKVPLERELVVHLIGRHSTRSGVIQELDKAIAFMEAGTSTDTLLEAITSTFKSVAAKKEKKSRAEALGFQGIEDESDD